MTTIEAVEESAISESDINPIDTIGDTPLVLLDNLFPQEHIKVYAKFEFQNPSGSIKDRIVKHIIEDAESSGLLMPGGTIVENTSGNTGAAIAMFGAAKGYKVILTLPDKVSDEKQNALRFFGAEVVVCRTDAEPGTKDHYVQRARDIASSIPGAFMINQYDNLKNSKAHYLTTGPEIWDQINGNIDYFIASGSTGGTISGTGRFLKEKKDDVKIVLIDPVGSIYYSYFKDGIVDENQIGTYQVEGIGEDHLAKCMDFSLLDNVIQSRDEDAFGMVKELIRTEGILAGLSSGTNLWGCKQIANEATSPTTIVTVLPDSGAKYLSKLLA